MNKNFSILHLSDLHYDDSKESVATLLVKKIIDDLNMLKQEQDTEIKLVLFTGDLVNFGGQADLFEKAYEKVVYPILKNLGLSESDFLYVPGNHELDRNEVDVDFQTGFIKRVLTAEVDKEKFDNKNLTARSRNYFDFINKFYKWDNKEVITNKVVDCENYKIGISLYNTAWTSSTYSEQDVKKIIMPPILAKKKSEEIKDCDFTIAMMHHPIDWYNDENGNRIQRCLSEYNFVFCGHKHLEDDKSEQKGHMKTLYSYAHKLLPLNDKESGYSILKILPMEKKVHLYFREFNDKVNGFSTAITNIDQEKNSLKYSEYDLGVRNNDLENTYKIYFSIKKKFFDNLDDLFITNTLDGNKKSFDGLFVDFSFTDYPSYSSPRKEGSDKENIIYYIKDIVDMSESVNIYGQKESGKTVLAYSLAKFIIDNFEKYKKIPIVLNCRNIGIYNTKISTVISSQLFQLLDEKSEVSKINIQLLLERNNFILICDEPKYLTVKQTKEINALEVKKIFINEYNPIVFGEDDKAYIHNELSKIKKNFYIKPYTKNEVRKLINNISIENNGDNQYVENVITYFYTTALPRTPFVISLIATICSKNKDVIPTNQAKILEQFLENVLEKINPIEQLSSTYDFNNKEDFLSCFAHKLYKGNKLSTSFQEFYEFVLQYHKEKGFSLDDSRFDKIFFEKNILVKEGESVYFRFSCFNYYYLAKYAIKHEDFKNQIIDISQIESNADILFYYTGLRRDDKDLLQKVITKMNSYLSTHIIDNDLFKQDPLKTNLGLTEKSISSLVEKSGSIKQEEKDKVTDRGDTSSKYNPNGVMIVGDSQSFERLLSVLGFTIKNSEELNATMKDEAMGIYIKGCHVLWNNFSDLLLKFAKEVNSEIINNSDKTDRDLQKMYDIFEDLLKICIPIVISQQIMENAATEKMKGIYEDLWDKFDFDTPEKMLLAFLLMDLNYKNSIIFVNKFIKNTENKNYLKVCLIKMIYSYLYGVTNRALLDPIADCYCKAMDAKKENKGKIMEEVKKKEFMSKFLVNKND